MLLANENQNWLQRSNFYGKWLNLFIFFFFWRKFEVSLMNLQGFSRLLAAYIENIKEIKLRKFFLIINLFIFCSSQLIINIFHMEYNRMSMINGPFFFSNYVHNNHLIIWKHFHLTNLLRASFLIFSYCKLHNWILMCDSW